jgi:hypothetical protein
VDGLIALNFNGAIDNSGCLKSTQAKSRQPSYETRLQNDEVNL